MRRLCWRTRLRVAPDIYSGPMRRIGEDEVAEHARKLAPILAHLELQPLDEDLAGRLRKKGVPEWQMFGEPRAVVELCERRFQTDPAPVSTNDLEVDTSRPVLFLDFDGVVSPMPVTRKDKSERGHLVFRKNDPGFVYIMNSFGMGSHFWVSLDLIAAAGELAATFDIVWSSSWGVSALPLGALVGWPVDLPFVQLRHDDPITGKSNFKTKHEAIAELIGSTTRPVVWCDDHQQAATQRLIADRPGPTLCIKPLKRHGLLNKHIGEMLTWAERL